MGCKLFKFELLTFKFELLREGLFVEFVPVIAGKVVCGAETLLIGD